MTPLLTGLLLGIGIFAGFTLSGVCVGVAVVEWWERRGM